MTLKFLTSGIWGILNAQARLHNMNAGFSPQILAQKLLKLNNSRQTPRERRVSLLYLANDIVQNSKKDSGRYVNEFWRVIPAALNDVFVNGDDFGRNVVQRLRLLGGMISREQLWPLPSTWGFADVVLAEGNKKRAKVLLDGNMQGYNYAMVDIWEERNIFGSHGQSLKEDYSRRFKEFKSKSRNSSGELLEKVISCYKHMLNAHVDDDTLMRKCQNALSFVDNLSNEYENNSILDCSNGSGFVEELQEQHNILRDSIEQFKTSELLRGNLISCLKEALHEQEFKMERARSQIKEVQSRYKKADDLCQKLGIHVERQEQPNHGPKNSGSEMHGSFGPDSANASSFEKGQSSAVMYSQENGGEHEIPNGVFSSRATKDNIEQKLEEHSTNKRQKLQNDVYVSRPQSPPPPLPSDAFEQPPPPPEHPPPPESTSPPPPPTSDPPPVPPPPPTTGSFMPIPSAPFAGLPVPAGPMAAVPYNSYPVFPPMNYPMVNIPPPFPSAPNTPPGFQVATN
uniref:CID domain-containing protein n=1 Tax=Oryza barthii TaxID=65489 RepID=A0A0D3EY24_9ORYZ